MVYRSFGINCSQGEVAARVAKPGPSGFVGARTFLVAQDALARGLGAIVFRATDPLRALRAGSTSSVRLILNHRPRQESPAGHFTVLVRVENDHVVVHDPQIGPNRRIRHGELLELWGPLGASSEITGKVLLAFTKERQTPAPCPKCGSTIPDTITCPGCRKLIPLHPAAVLGCINASCAARNWEILFCPYCDMGLVNPSAQGSSNLPSPGASPPEADEDPLKVEVLNQHIDNFLAVVLKCVKGQPPAAMADAITTLRKKQADLVEVQKKRKAERTAKAEEPPPAPAPQAAPLPEPPVAMAPQRPPVDWNELGRKLVEEVSKKPTR